MDSIAYPIYQDRGRLTVDRLLDAAEHLLAHDGLEAATVPAIAEAADLAVGTVYKRFPDKDALLRAAYMRFFTRSAEKAAVALAPSLWADHSAYSLIATLLPALIQSYRKDRTLYRALFQFAETHSDAKFRAQAEQMVIDAASSIGALLRARRAEMTHADPDAAVDFILHLLLTAARGLVMSDLVPRNAPTADPVRLAAELRQITLQYLGVTYPPVTPKRTVVSNRKR
jgi:AcrR family transcriptional regulator